ncbi:MAG: hypothetical protein HC945_01725, partial [Nitrosarchaeum sp.]|nr:hypothetical protein [Nitrosarchaeum sp.]
MRMVRTGTSKGKAPAGKALKAKRATKAIVPGKEAGLDEIKALLEEVLRNQRKMLEEEREVLSAEEELSRREGEALAEEAQVLQAEKKQMSELAELESLEKEIAQEVRAKPLARITHRDFYKAIIGAFFGIVGHFSFFYGTKIAHEADFTLGRAILLYVVSFVLAVLFMYFAGFRKVDRQVWKYLPWRVGVIYL